MEIINWIKTQSPPTLTGYFLINYSSYDNTLNETFTLEPLSSDDVAARSGWLDYWNTEDCTIMAYSKESEDGKFPKGSDIKSFTNRGDTHNLTPEEHNLILDGDIEEISALINSWINSINTDGKFFRLEVMSIDDHYSTTSYGRIAQWRRFN